MILLELTKEQLKYQIMWPNEAMKTSPFFTEHAQTWFATFYLRRRILQDTVSAVF